MELGGRVEQFPSQTTKIVSLQSSFSARFQEDGQKRKMVIKIEFTPLSDCNIFPFY